MTAESGTGASVAASPIPRKRLRRRYKPAVRSLTDMDRRYKAARDAAKLIARLEAELPGGAPPTAAQHELCVRAGLLSALCGDAEIAIIKAQAIDVSAYCTLANTQRRILSALGISRDPKLINGHASASTGHADADDAEVSRLLSYFEPDNETTEAVAK
jgi:hypothetical protein